METKVYFDLKDLMGIAMLLVVTGIGVSYGLQVNADVRDDMTAGTAEYTAANQSVAAVAKIPAKMGTIVTIVLAAIVIGILIRYLWVKFG